MQSRRNFLRGTALHRTPQARALRANGYSSARYLGSGDMNERYFRNRADGFRMYGSGYMMNAQV